MISRMIDRMLYGHLRFGRWLNVEVSTGPYACPTLHIWVAERWGLHVSWRWFEIEHPRPDDPRGDWIWHPLTGRWYGSYTVTLD